MRMSRARAFDHRKSSFFCKEKADSIEKEKDVSVTNRKGENETEIEAAITDLF